MKVGVRLKSVTFVPGYPANAPRPQRLIVRPKVECRSGGEGSANTSCDVGIAEIGLPLIGFNTVFASGGQFNVGFSWVRNPDRTVQPNDLETFVLGLSKLDYKFSGGSYDRVSSSAVWISPGLGDLPRLRCDRGEIKGSSSSGCVFVDAAAVYTVSAAKAPEAAEHIREAQRGTRLYADQTASPGSYGMKPNTRAIADPSAESLQRARPDKVIDRNRIAACKASNALIDIRLPKNQSASCATDPPKCNCDEYPFASTWDGASQNSNRTSTKQISGADNRAAGNGNLGWFYAKQRVLDRSLDELTNLGGDRFWVYVE
jgi:hypothetical protein